MVHLVRSSIFLTLTLILTLILIPPLPVLCLAKLSRLISLAVVLLIPLPILSAHVLAFLLVFWLVRVCPCWCLRFLKEILKSAFPHRQLVSGRDFSANFDTFSLSWLILPSRLRSPGIHVSFSRFLSSKTLILIEKFRLEIFFNFRPSTFVYVLPA